MYISQNGPLNLGLRIDWAIARAVQPFLKNATVRQLMPFPKEDERVATLDDMAALFKVAAAKTKAVKVRADGK